ncbi:putative coat protein [Allium polerovirus A]|uniref:Coat protein n=1 Tax=Allium polerovirus A TaxID=2593979 RepID=A0AAE9T2J5_9VIRU|nr:putative coat protein [Allium polerovirus A]
MNTAVVRNNRNARRRPRRNQRRPAVQLVAVSAPPGGAQRRRRRRRGGRNRRRNGGISRASSNGETFVFSKDGLQGSSTGSITFGPSLSECPAFATGILRAYHEYKITMVQVEFISEASSTSAGSIAYELDAHCKSSALTSTIYKFGITEKRARRSFPARTINGISWHAADEDQFRFLYKGNGKSEIAGSFKITIRVMLQNPK